MFSLLHIDNNFFYKEILMNLSKEKNFKYYSAKTPSKAYEILLANDIDVIVTGLEFESESGEEFISTLVKKKHKTTSLIVLTATEDPCLKEKLFEMGITEYLTKNVFIEYLNTFIQRLSHEDIIASQLTKLSICVLDDNKPHLATLKKYFENCHVHNVDYYSHPQNLLSSNKKYNIYIIDLIMPEITGEQIISTIRENDEYAVIIAVSSIDSISVISDILNLGADDYIAKPLTEKLFMARIKANVRTYALTKKLKEKNLELEHLVKEDGLTKLYNHKCIIETLEKEIDRSTRYKKPLSVIMLDIDRFKVVNDTYGHHIGDEVLAKVGMFLKQNSREFDIVGRYGGEEFLLILPETTLRGAILYGNRLRTDIENLKFSEKDLKITVSGGISILNKETASELIQNADKLLYLAKHNGRNRIEFD